MGRLIDSDDVKKAFREHNRPLDYIVDEVPTAYDVNKVIDELEDKSYDSMHIDTNTPMTDTWQIINTDSAIEIVKKGGIE